MIGFCPLASGSRGNSVYLGTPNTKILIDAGISAKQIRERLLKIGVDVKDIEAILITHEHMDHIEGLKVLGKRKDLSVLANAETAKGIYQNLGIVPSFKIFTTGEPFEYKDIEVEPFSIQHDTLDPVGFVIKTCGKRIGFCTDIGFVTAEVIKKLKCCDFLYLEANHQPSMVHASQRPLAYKQRVLGRQGHLSNDESLYLLENILHPGLKHIYFAHLSSECNSKDLVMDLMQQSLLKRGLETKISIAYQNEVSSPTLFSCTQEA